MKEEGQIYKKLPRIFQFLPWDLDKIFEGLSDDLPHYLKDHNEVPRQKLRNLR